MKKMLFIMNPCSGTRKANKVLADILSIFNRADYTVEVYMTACRGDATRVAREKADQFDVIVCCGGDGTFSETMSGILQAGATTPMGYIPAGSTNDFANSLGLPTNLLKAAEVIANGEPRPIDVGKFGDHHFSYVASFGAFTRTSYATSQKVKNALGHTAYILGGIQELSNIHKIHIRLDMEDQTLEEDVLFGAISNSTSVAGIVSLDPNQVDMSDGLLEVMLVRAPKSLAEITECLTAIQSKQYNCRMITFCKASQIRVTADPEMPWTLDGEKAEGQREILITAEHLAIQVMQEKKA